VQKNFKPTSVLKTNNGQENNINNKNNKISFSDIDYISNADGNIVPVTVPKTIENLEKISSMRYEQRQKENSDDEDDKIKISSENINLDSLDIHIIEEPQLELFPDLLIDAEVLE